MNQNNGVTSFPGKVTHSHPRCLLRETLMLYLFAEKVECSGLKCLQTAKFSVTEGKKKKKRKRFDPFKIFSALLILQLASNTKLLWLFIAFFFSLKMSLAALSLKYHNAEANQKFLSNSSLNDRVLAPLSKGK